MFVILYDMWEWVSAISAVIGIFSVIVTLFKVANKDSAHNRFILWCINALAIAAGTAVCVSCIIGMQFSKVPRVYGCTVNEADTKLTDSGLSISFQPDVNRDENWSSMIVSQSIDEDSLVPKGTRIIVYLSNEEAHTNESQENVGHDAAADIFDGMVTVPEVVGMEQTEATALLTQSGLQFQVWWTLENDVPVEYYYIIGQSIPADSIVPLGTLVELEISPYKP